MVSDAVVPLISNEMVSYITKVFICFSSLILFFSFNCFDRAANLKDLKDNPDKNFLDQEMVEFTKTKYITSDIRAEKFKGVVGCIVSLLGVFLLINISEPVSTQYAAFVFASYAVVALTIRAFFLSVACCLQSKRFKKAELENGYEGAAKKLIELNNKYLARTASITVAGLLLSAYLLYHVTPQL